MAATAGLTALSLAELEAIRRAIRKGLLPCPLTEDGLSACDLGATASRAQFLLGHDPAATLSIIDAVIAERRGARGPVLDLVWTGPEVSGFAARDTAVVVRELFGSAQRTVLVAGFSFDNGADIFAPLHSVMRDHGVETSIYLDIPRAPAGAGALSDYARAAAERFLMANWPFGAPVPVIYYDPRTIAPDSVSSLHAKCIVVDEERALVTSANFTSRGQERNLEVGVLIRDVALATELVARFRSLVARGLLETADRSG